MNAKFLLCVVLSVLFSFITLHSGGTDANGGHYDSVTGEYHYHHGYPAHQHINGVCPYDYDDRTGENSGSSSSITRTSVSKTNTKDAVWDIIENVFIAFVWIYVAYKIVWDFFIAPRLRESAQKNLARKRFENSVKKAKIHSVKKLSSPSLPAPVHHISSLPVPLDRNEHILYIITNILNAKSPSSVFLDSPEFMDALKTSMSQIPDDPNANEETMSYRILARSSFSVLLYRDKNSLPDSYESLSNYLLYEILRDSLLWLLKSKYYTVERYDSIVNTINVTLRKMDIKKQPPSA